MPRRLLSGRTGQRHSERRSSGLGEANRLDPPRRLGRPLPAGRGPGTSDHAAQVTWLSRQRLVHGGDLRGAGSVLDRGDRRLADRAEENRAHLVQGQVVLAAGRVADHCGEESRQQRGPQVGGGVGERVRQPHQLPTRVIDRDLHPVQVSLGDERELHHLDEAGYWKRRRDSPT